MTELLHRPEILAPAGDREKLLYALAYGADAVYLAGDSFSLRVNSGNFDLPGIEEAVRLAHAQGVRVYVAVNIYAHNEDIALLPPYLEALAAIGPDGLIISDLGVFALAGRYAPNIPRHISTQANTVNHAAVAAWQELGAARVVLGRELSLDEIRAIRSTVELPLEVFVHGAMCMSYSGRCLLSNYLTGRDSNRGACTHPCRWRYRLVEEQRPGQYLPIEEDARGSYIMNSKDLNLLPYLPELMAAGVDAFKIEGRVKSAYYVAAVTRVYRRAVDDILAADGSFERHLDGYLAELGKVSHRHYCDGFIAGKPDGSAHRYDSSAYRRDYDFIAVVKDYDAAAAMLIVEQRNRFVCGDRLEILSPDGADGSLTVTAMYDADGSAVSAAPHPQMTVRLPYAAALPPLTILRRQKHDDE